MKKQTKIIILTLVGIQLVLIAVVLASPKVVRAIPGRYRVALQERVPLVGNALEGVIDQVAPMATALPVAHQSGGGEVVDIEALIAARPTTVPSPTPTVESALETAVDSDSITPESVDAAALTPSPTPAPTQTPTPEPLPLAHVLEDMGVVQQSFNNCGPANLTQVLNWYGSDITQEEIASYLKPNPEDRNVSPWQIRDYVNEQTGGEFKATAHSGGTPELLKRLIVAGYPVVIEKGYEVPSQGWYGHYLTVYGYDDELEQFYTQDSYLGPFDGRGRLASYEEVTDFWPEFNYTFYVVYKPEQEEEVAAIIGPELWDEETMWRATAARAQAEIEADPENAFAWYNLGTSLTELGEMVLEGNAEYYGGAVQAFDKARELGLPPRMLWYQHKPYIAYDKVGRYQDVIDLADATLVEQGGRNVEETYWYKGHALAAQGDLYGAKDAYQSALVINANFYPAQISLDWVNSLINGG